MQNAEHTKQLCGWRIPKLWKKRVHILSAISGKKQSDFITAILEERFKDFDFDSIETQHVKR